MNPGRLDRRLLVQKRTVGRDTTGSPVKTWADDGTVWAELVRQSGRERSGGDAVRDVTETQFRLRARTLDASAYRLSYQGRIYDIKAVDEEGRNRMLLVTCETRRGLG